MRKYIYVLFTLSTAAILFYFTTFKLPIVIEHKKGSVRSGTDLQGERWSQTMYCDYGYFPSIMGKDGKHLDAYVDPDSFPILLIIGRIPNDCKIFKITQLNSLTGKLDEHKIMIGFDNIFEAKAMYLRHYPDDWAGYGGIEEIRKNDLLNYENRD